MSKLIILSGLPGSGKTTYIESLKTQGFTGPIYDDYYATQHNERIDTVEDVDRNKDPVKNERFEQLITDLKNNPEVIVADIIFYIARHRNSLLVAVLNRMPNIDLKFVYLPVKIDTSIENIEKRNRNDRVTIEKELVRYIADRATKITVTEL
ncbi:MAG: AAA family ATPase [Candidatus Saccharimonadales bacterium]